MADTAGKYIPGLGEAFQVAPEETSFQIAYQADSVAADVATLVSDFNALLQKLRDVGLMKAE